MRHVALNSLECMVSPLFMVHLPQPVTWLPARPGVWKTEVEEGYGGAGVSSRGREIRTARCPK